MAEGLVLTDLENVDAHRAALVGDIPNIFDAAGAHGPADQYRKGNYEGVIDWVKSEVSMGMHGFQQGKFGVVAENEPDVNILAQKHDLIGPVRLWTPGDNIPEGKRAGHIAEYKIIPEAKDIKAEVLKSEVFVAQGATHDGMIGRIDNVLQAAAHSEASKNPDTLPEVVVLTGMRRTEEREGKSGLYQSTLRPDAAPGKPIEDVNLTEADSALAILQSRCQRFDLVDEIADPEAGNKPDDRIHPELGGREWVIRRYAAQLTDERGGKMMMVSVVNGEPILTPERLNAGKAPSPLAVETLRDWLNNMSQDKQLDVAISVTYTHLARIASELLARSQEMQRPFGRIALMGNMPQPAVWNRMPTDERTGHVVHNGASLVLGEVIPQIKAFNGLLGRPDFDIAP
jgi:hypothetical protein